MKVETTYTGAGNDLQAAMNEAVSMMHNERGLTVGVRETSKTIGANHVTDRYCFVEKRVIKDDIDRMIES